MSNVVQSKIGLHRKLMKSVKQLFSPSLYLFETYAPLSVFTVFYFNKFDRKKLLNKYKLKINELKTIIFGKLGQTIGSQFYSYYKDFSNVITIKNIEEC